MLIVSKLARMVATIEGLLPIMLLYHLITCSCEITRQTISVIYIHYHSPIMIKPGRIVTNLPWLLPIILLYILVR